MALFAIDLALKRATFKRVKLLRLEGDVLESFVLVFDGEGVRSLWHKAEPSFLHSCSYL